jgi:excisionase family DNA binding protein
VTVLTDRPVFPPKDPNDLRELDRAAHAPAGSRAALVTPEGVELPLPEAVFDVLLQVVAAMRAGRAVNVAPLAQRLTTQEAAELLGVSRPTLIKVLDEGKIPFELLSGSRHRRILLSDVLAYQQTRRAQQEAALTELVKLGEEMDLYDHDDPGSSAETRHL